MDFLTVRGQPEPETREAGDNGNPVIVFKSIAKKVEKANIVQAEMYREKTSIRIIDENEDYQLYPICKTRGDQLGKYGIGLQLYFFFIKQFGILFFLLSIISTYSLYCNYSGEGFRSTYQNQRYTYFTLANQDGVKMYETELENAIADMQKSKDNLERLWPIDVFSSIVFLFFILLYAWLSHRIIEKSGVAHFSVSDFSLEVEGFPPFITKEQVLDYFTPYGEVIEIYLSRVYNGKLKKYKKIFEISYKQELEKLESYNMNRSRSTEIALKILNSKTTLKETHDELMVDKAFVVFDTIESKLNFIKENTGKHKRRWFGKNYDRRKMDFRLKVKSAHDPSDILWENLEYTSLKRMKTRIPILIITVMIIIISFIMIYGIKAYYNTIPNSTSCKELIVSGKMSLDQAKTMYTKQKEINCYCKQQEIDYLISNNDLGQFCSVYIKSFTTSALINTSVSAVILIVNIILKIIINVLSKYQRFKYKTQRKNYVLITTSILMLINTGLTTLLANSSFSFGVVQGNYSDLTREWYDDVGNTITVTIIVSIFSPHAFDLVFLYPLSMLKRKLFYRFFKSQYKLNKFFRGPNFDISDSLSQLLAVIFTSFMYSAGIPFLNILCGVALFITYWVNKLLLLRYYRTPPVYSHNINDKMLKFMPFVIIFHCAFAIYAYGSSEIFPTGYTKKASSNYVIPHHTTFLGRIGKKHGIVYMIVIGLSFLTFVALKRLNAFNVKKFRRGKIYDESHVLTASFTKLKAECKFSGITSYNIYENPEYSFLICALDSVAHQKKELEKSKIDDESDREKLDNSPNSVN